MDTTGISGLDEVTGGLPLNGLTQILGPPGTGKTVLAMQVAAHAVDDGRDVLYLSVYSEPHEKLIAHMQNFSFFDESQVGSRIEMVSLKTILREGVEPTVATIMRTSRTKTRPLIILDGYRGLRTAVGAEAAQELLATLSSQMPYQSGSCLVCSESSPDEAEQYQELASADAILSLSMMHYGARTYRRLEVLKMRGHTYREGMHGMAITADGIKLFPRLATCLPDVEPRSSGSRLTFGLAELDTMLGGGLPEHSLTVIFGEPGTGKTTLGLQYLVSGAQAGERGILLTFREPTSALLQKATDLGVDLSGQIERGTVDVWRVPPIEIDPDLLAWQLRERVESRRIDRVVIDGVSELERASRLLGSETDYLAALSEYLRRSGVSTLMMQDGIPASFDAAQALSSTVPLAQNRIILRRIEYRGKLYRICAILNMQESKHDTSIREFRIEQGGIHILRPDESDRGVLAGIVEEQPLRG